MPVQIYSTRMNFYFLPLTLDDQSTRMKILSLYLNLSLRLSYPQPYIPSLVVMDLSKAVNKICCRFLCLSYKTCLEENHHTRKSFQCDGELEQFVTFLSKKEMSQIAQAASLQKATYYNVVVIVIILQRCFYYKRFE